MKALPKRYRDARILVTKTVGREYYGKWRIANKGDILDGWIDSDGNFNTKSWDDRGLSTETTIYPTHFKILGKFYFRKAGK